VTLSSASRLRSDESRVAKVEDGGLQKTLKIDGFFGMMLDGEGGRTAGVLYPPP
jgi:hypothetical protein